MSQAYKQQCFQRQKRKEISPHASTCTRAYMCPPQLNRISGCASVESVCCYYFATTSIHCVRLSVCTCTSVCPDACIYNPEVLSVLHKHLMLGQPAVISTHTYTYSHYIQHCHASTLLCKQPRETHSHRSEETPAKTPGGRADNWLLDK
jgi:hypothetical protein